MSWSKKRGPNMQAPDLQREHRASVLLSPGRSADVGHQRKLGVSYTAISAAPGQRFYGAPAQA